MQQSHTRFPIDSIVRWAKAFLITGSMLFFCDSSLVATELEQDNVQAIKAVEASLLQMQEQSIDNWKFDAVEKNQKTVYRMTFHPIQKGEGKVELLDINNEKPNEKQVEDFEKSHPPRKPKAIEKTGVELSEMIAPGTLKLQSSEDGVSLFTFTPQFAFDKEPSSEYPLSGIITYQEAEDYVSNFHVTTDQTFSPKFGMKVENFSLELAFKKHPSQIILPQKVHTEFKGKAFVLMTIQQDIEITYFNYVPPESIVDTHQPTAE